MTFDVELNMHDNGNERKLQKIEDIIEKKDAAYS